MNNKVISLGFVLSFILSVGIIHQDAHALYFSPADSFCPNHPKVCAIFSALDAEVTPLPVMDFQASVGLVMDQVEQTMETVKSGLQYVEKVKKMTKWSLAGSDLSKKLPVVGVPTVEDFIQGSETRVDAYKGNVPGKELPPVDFRDNKQVAKTVQAVAVVSSPENSPERLAEQERKDAFIQQSVLDVLARTLYYKHQLEELRQTDADLQAITGSGDTAGSVDISMRVKDVDERVQALQEKIMAARLELQAIQNLKAAVPVRENAEAAVDRYGSYENNGDADESDGAGGGIVPMGSGEKFMSAALKRLKKFAQNALNNIEYDNYTGYPASWKKVEFVDCINQNANKMKSDVSKYYSTKSKLSRTLQEFSSNTEKAHAGVMENIPTDASSAGFLNSVKDSYNDTLESSLIAMDGSVVATNSAVSMIVSSLLVRIQDAINANQHPALIAMICSDILQEAENIVNNILVAGTESIDHLTSQTATTLSNVANQSAANADPDTQNTLNTLYQTAQQTTEAAAINAKNEIVEAGASAQEVFNSIAQLHDDLMQAVAAEGVSWDWIPGQTGFLTTIKIGS